MDMTNKRLNSRKGKRITLRLGRVGGIGGVVLFAGGALVAAAFASAFVLRRIRRRRTSEDRRDRTPTEIEKQRGGEEEAREGREIHISSDTSLRGEQSEKETERDDSHMLVNSHGSIKAAIPGTENSVEVPAEKEETLVSTTLSKPENDVISSDSLFIEECSRSCVKPSLPLVENPQKIHCVADKDFASEVTKDEAHEILETKDKDDALAVDGSQSTYGESIQILNVEKTELGESNVEIDAKKHDDEVTEEMEGMGYIHGSLMEAENLVEDKHEDVANDVIMAKSVVCEAGDLDNVSKQEDIEEEDDDDDGDHMETESSLEVESSDESGDSSLESNSDAVCPTEYLKESTVEPRGINAGEVEGKMMQEDIMAGGNNDSKFKEDSISSKRRMLVAMLLMLSWALALWLLLGQALFQRLLDDGSLGIKSWV